MSTSVTVQPARWPGGAHLRRLARSPALRVSGRRLLSAIPVLWGVTLLAFLVMNALPGDAASALLGINATKAEIRAFSIKLHLNEPLWTRYGHWLAGVVTGNLGTSLASPQSVASILGQRLPVTLELVIFALIITLVVSVPVSVLCARRPGGVVDRLSLVLSMGSISIAPYVLALLAVIVFCVKWSVFPAIGYVPLSQGIGGNLHTITLPSIILAVPLIGFYIRFLRGDLVEQMQAEDYVVTARAKGVSEWRVLTRHALRNSFIGLLTVIGLNLATLIGATVIVEDIFSLPGIGYELLNAISNRNVPVVEGIVLVFGIAVVLANLLTDLLYGVLDPRIRHVRSRS
ncbi:MAG TPA: ABC transporter permease [Streptosporangiaceae bacterium]|nr:ABC transporter permease [Streptosporangiaceae bacterium]